MSFASDFVSPDATERGPKLAGHDPLTRPEKMLPPAGRHLTPTAGLAFAWMLAALTGALIVQAVDPAADRVRAHFLTATSADLPVEPIDRAEAVALSRAVLLRLDDANRTGNYAVFREMSAPAFQAINSANDLQRIFGWLREQGQSLASAASLDADALRPSVLEKGGFLHVRGAMPGVPGGLSFDLLLQQSPGDSHWRVFGIAVYRG